MLESGIGPRGRWRVAYAVPHILRPSPTVQTVGPVQVFPIYCGRLVGFKFRLRRHDEARGTGRRVLYARDSIPASLSCNTLRPCRTRSSYPNTNAISNDTKVPCTQQNGLWETKQPTRSRPPFQECKS